MGMTETATVDAEIYRDSFGTPHVFGETIEAAYFGLGYCAAQDRPCTLPLHQLLVQGRLAEQLGDCGLPIPTFPLLDHLQETPFFRGYAENSVSLDTIVGIDRWTRNFGYYSAAIAELDELSDRSRTIVEAFAAGVNHYFEKHGAPDGYEEYRPATELAWWTWYEHTIAMGFFISNAFAIGPSKSVSGSGWVAGDPHYWFMDGHSEAHVVCPELELIGMWDGHVNLGFWGGTNTDFAFGITAAGLEGAAVYRERLNPENREEYFDWRTAGYRPLEKMRHEIQVKGGETVVFVARRTHHGAVVGEALMEGSPVAYTIRSPVDGHSGRRLDQWLGVWTQRSVDDFIAYTEEAEYVRSHRVCIDRDGNIGYVCNGPVPVRSDEFDWSKPVDGSIPDTELGDKRWRPNAAEYGLPSFTNPSCGFIQSANDPPWVTTVPALTGTEFPKYVFPDGWRNLGTRGARQRHLLLDTEKLSALDLESLLLDVFVPKAYYGIRALRASFEAAKGTLPELSDAAKELDRILASWDGRAEVESIGMTIAFYLDRILTQGIPEPIVEVTDDPIARPEMREPAGGGGARDYALALEAVGQILQTQYGTLEKKWGDIHVIWRPDGDFGIPGGCNSLRALVGTWHGWWDVDDVVDADGVERCNFGSRVLRLTELGPDVVSVRSISLTGQMPAGEHPGSPHVLDQSTLYARLQLKQLPLTRTDVLADSHETSHALCNHEAVETISALSLSLRQS
jgi:acyl-homoserine-lactone acylase